MNTANPAETAAMALGQTPIEFTTDHRDGGIHVLHVDDESDFATMAAEFVRRQDDRITMETTTSPSEALALLHSDGIDCIVSDFEMPDQNGIELLRDVRESHPELPFILFTGKGSEEVASEAISAGVTDYLQKAAGTDQYAVLANRITNVVDQYHAERRADRMSRLLDAILDNTTTPMFLKNADGAYLLVNQGFKDLLDIEMDEAILGRSDEELFPPDEISNIIQNDRRVLDQGESIQVEERIPINGDVRVFLSSKVPIYDLGGSSTADQPVAMFGVARDITELKARERELHRSRDLLEHTERLASTGGWEADVETGQQRWTDGTYAVHDIDPDSGFDPTVDAGVGYYHPDDRETIRLAVEQCMEAGESYEVELRLLTAEDRLRWVRASGEAIYEDGEIVTVRGAIQDITDLISREQALVEQNERLEEFVNIVGHDLRNPLSAARARLSLAREDRDSDHLEATARAHERIESMIEELMELAKAGSEAADTEPLAIANVIETPWRYLDSPEATLIKETEMSVYADNAQLELLLGNLLRNAIEHGGPDVTITLGELDEGFFVEDDGPGIPPEERDVVLESGHTTKPDGTGFGLDVVQRVVEAHDWSIEITNGRAGGARFEISNVELVAA